MHISLWMLLLTVCRMKRVYERSLDISLEFFVVLSPKTIMKCSVQIFKLSIASLLNGVDPDQMGSK